MNPNGWVINVNSVDSVSHIVEKIANDGYANIKSIEVQELIKRFWKQLNNLKRWVIIFLDIFLIPIFLIALTDSIQA